VSKLEKRHQFFKKKCKNNGPSNASVLENNYATNPINNMSPSKQVEKSTKGKYPKGTKKAPGAPKRFCSSYILFFMHHQKRIKDSLPEMVRVI
jgi:hypothetical protein